MLNQLILIIWEKCFCYQCQEAAKGIGCLIVCGKSDYVANLQDLLLFVMKGISYYSLCLNEMNCRDKEAIFL